MQRRNFIRRTDTRIMSLPIAHIRWERRRSLIYILNHLDAGMSLCL